MIEKIESYNDEIFDGVNTSADTVSAAAKNTGEFEKRNWIQNGEVAGVVYELGPKAVNIVNEALNAKMLVENNRSGGEDKISDNVNTGTAAFVELDSREQTMSRETMQSENRGWVLHVDKHENIHQENIAQGTDRRSVANELAAMGRSNIDAKTIEAYDEAHVEELAGQRSGLGAQTYNKYRNRVGNALGGANISKSRFQEAYTKTAKDVAKVINEAEKQPLHGGLN